MKPIYHRRLSPTLISDTSEKAFSLPQSPVRTCIVQFGDQPLVYESTQHRSLPTHGKSSLCSMHRARFIFTNVEYSDKLCSADVFPCYVSVSCKADKLH